MSKVFKSILNTIPRPWLISMSLWVRPLLDIYWRGHRYTDPPTRSALATRIPPPPMKLRAVPEPILPAQCGKITPEIFAHSGAVTKATTNWAYSIAMLRAQVWAGFSSTPTECAGRAM